MPELPEVQALAAFLTERAVGRVVARVDTVAISALKTFDPPITALAGLEVTAAGRHGKFLDVEIGASTPGAPDGLHLVTHLARAGWLHWREQLPEAPPRPGKGPIAVRVHLDDGSGFDLTEAGTRKGLSVYVVRDPGEVPGIVRLGPDALSLDEAALGAVLAAAGRAQIKGVLTEQTVLAGIGNAYSDEILWAAQLSPFAPAAGINGEALTALHEAIGSTLTEATERAVGQEAAKLKGEKRAGLKVHARTGQPCPRCGDPVREVSFADKSLQYCSTCQTRGKPLADRRMSKLLK